MKRALHSLLLIGPVPPPSGGVATAIRTLGQAVARRGVPIEMIDPAKGRAAFARRAARARAGRALVHVHVCGHNVSSYGLVAAARLLSVGAPFVLTLHSGILPEYLGALARAGRAALRVLLERADRVVCVSAANQRAVAALGVDPARLLVVSPFIADGLSLRDHPVGAGSTLAAMVAPEVWYGASLLVDGFAAFAEHHSEARLVVFGAGGADREVARALAGRGLGDRVHARGELAHEDVLELLSRADVLVRPTLADGDSVTVREALALGCRVVASDAVARPAAARTFPVGDAEALAAALERALGEPPPPRDTSDGLAPMLALYSALGLPVEQETARATCAL